MAIYVAMSMGVLLLLALAPAAGGIDFTSEELSSEEATLQLYKRWCGKYPGGRGCNLDDNSKQFEIFKARAREINDMNQGVVHNHRHLNEFSDITKEEFIESYASCYTKSGEEQDEHDIIPNEEYDYANDDIPENIDWSLRGAVTPVRAQNGCGCCWAFAAAGAVESVHKIENGVLMPLSVQELLDCSKRRDGCKGGDAAHAFRYIVRVEGITSWERNPYMGRVWRCQQSKKVVTIGGFRRVPPSNETALMQAVARQPVVVGVDVTDWAIHYRAGTVFRGPCGNNPNHQVLVVGYGTTREFEPYSRKIISLKYWIIKNSWGVHRGEEGYYRLERGGESSGGLCGILKDPMYPIEPFEVDDD